MKHAYLIMIHDNWEQLKILLSLLDSEDGDIFIHVCSGVKMPDVSDIKGIIKKSRLFFSERVAVKWGGFGICSASFKLLETAVENGTYDYFHLLSGSDLPIKPIKQIELFFENNVWNNQSFNLKTNYLSFRCPSDNLKSRIVYYNFFTSLFGSRNYIVRKFATSLNHILCIMQKFLGINRFKNSGCMLYQGSAWWSLSHEAVEYVLNNKTWIEKNFKRMTFASDEFVFQILLLNSKFKDSLYMPKGNQHSNLRLIDFERGNGYGSPHVWVKDDKKEIVSSGDLFARKFNMNIDKDIIELICGTINMDVGGLE